MRITRVELHDGPIREMLKSAAISQVTQKAGQMIANDASAVPGLTVTSRDQRTRKSTIVGSNSQDANFTEATTGALARASAQRRNL